MNVSPLPPEHGLLRKLGPFVGIALFGAALWVLQDWLRGQNYQQLAAAMAAIPSRSVSQAAVLVAAGYAVMTGYDWLALRYVRRRVPRATLLTTAFIANAVGNNFGNTLITGAAVRYWSYAAAGLSASEIARVALFCSVGFWGGCLFLAGVVFTFDPLALPPALRWAGATTRPVGLLFLSVVAGYMLLTTSLKVLRRPAWLRHWRTLLPSPALSAAQIALASVDLCLMSAVFYALLPAEAAIDFSLAIAVFLVALVAGAVSFVPGGLGVFETAVVLLLGARMAPVELAVVLLAFRGVYFVGPLFVAFAVLGARESAARLPALRTRLALGAQSLLKLSPQILATMVFVAGAVLLFSGSLPATTGRLEVLNRVLSLPLIEASHFLASLAGAALLLLAHGLQRRLDAAWHLSLLLLLAGAVLSLGKGLDYEEATLLLIAIAVLLPARGQFHRQSSLLGEAFSPAWMGAAAVVLAASAWLIQFSQSSAWNADLSWWLFALQAEEPRALRATVGAASLAALYGLYRLLRPLRPAIPQPSSADLRRARAIVDCAPQTYANLVLRGDKALLFSEANDAFLMYGRSGRSWIAMGDPVGTAEGGQELRWRFRDLCDRFDGWCVFFEVHDERRDDYAEIGLGLTPLGEEARVELTRFDLAARGRRELRHTCHRLQRRGCRFEIVPRESVAALVPALERVSNAWLAAKTTREKGFSNASFDAHYLQQFPVAIVRHEQQVVAFANLWLGAGKQELSIDLMRHLPTAPKGSMDYLFCELMQWGRAQGYRWFNFGMAPLSGLDRQDEAPLWGSVGTLLYRHGEHFYNFEGLRHYKAKFDPVWRPLYLASPGGVALPRILLDVTALMAGGVAGIVSKRGSRRRPRP